MHWRVADICAPTTMAGDLNLLIHDIFSNSIIRVLLIVANTL